MKTIRDNWLTWLLAITVIVYIAIIFSSCASNDPVPPIQYYREAHGFPIVS